MISKNTALTAKASAIYGNRITGEQYNTLLHKLSLPQVVDVLKNTKRYKKELRAVSEQQVHREQLEYLLNQAVFNHYIRLYKYSYGTGFPSFYLLEKEFLIILDVINFLYTGQKDRIISYLPVYMNNYVSFDLMALGNVRGFNDLLRVLHDTHFYKILKNCEKADFEEMSLILYKDYYKHLLSVIDRELHGTEASELRRLVERRIATDNLFIIYRMKTYFNLLPEEIKRLIKPFYRGLSKNNIEQIINANQKTSTELITTVLNKKFLFKTAIFDNKFPELAVMKNDFDSSKRRLRVSGNPAVVFYSIMKLLEIEKHNIISIIEGVKYSMPAQEIEKLLVI